MCFVAGLRGILTIKKAFVRILSFFLLHYRIF